MPPPISLHSLVLKHREFVRTHLLGITDSAAQTVPPPAGWSAETWHIRHLSRPPKRKSSEISDDLAEAYPVTVHIPPGFREHVRGETTNDEAERLIKADVQGRHTCTDGRWITMHPNGSDEKGNAVYICPNPDGSHTVVGGAGGRLNGLRLRGVRTEASYKHMARSARDLRIKKAKADRTAHAELVGAEQARQENQEKAAVIAGSRSNRRAAERDAITTVLSAQGVQNPAGVLDLPPESLSGMDKKTAQTLQARHHEKLLSYARRVGDSVRALVDAGVEGVVQAATGDVGVADLLGRTNSGGTGYKSPVSDLARDMGVSDDELAGLTEGVTLRAIMDRDHINLQQAGEQTANAKVRATERADAEKRVKDAAEQVTTTLPPLPTTAGVSTMGEAVAVLSALKNADTAISAHRAVVRAASLVQGGIETIPKALLVPTRALSPEEAKDAVAADISENRRRAAMIALVKDSNEITKDAPKSMIEHLSVGQSAAFNTICGALSGDMRVDPILHDLLGASGAAAVIAARLRATLSPEAFGAAKDVLAEHHVKTQEAIAGAATATASEYQNQADAIGVPTDMPTDADGIAGALLDERRKRGLLDSARETLGVARGRLEASSALNAAISKTKDGPFVLPLGSTTPANAVSTALALGLNVPASYDKNTGNVTDAGQYDIHHDGHNAFLSLTPAGITALANRWLASDPDIAERADRSQRIKSGAEDEAGYVPEGLTNRPVSAHEVDPLEVQRPDVATLTLADSDSPDTITDKVRAFTGAMLGAGRDTSQVESLLRSEEFKAGLGLTNASVTRYESALSGLLPQWTPRPGMTPQAQVAAYDVHKANRDAAYQSCLDEHLKTTVGANTAIDGQRLPTDAVVADCAYVAALKDPRLRYAFHKVGDLDAEARACVRRYAYEHLFHLDPKGDNGQTQGVSEETLLTPLSPEEGRAYAAWNALGDRSGEQYGAIQAHWRDESGKETDLFGDPTPAHVIATVNLSDDTSVVNAAKAVPKMLGYAGTQGRDPNTGAIVQGYADLDPSADRSLSTIATDARARIRQALRKRFLSNMCSLPDLADADFNPASVKTASDRWGEYASSMGDTNAYRATQEFMRGDFAKRFAGEYAVRTGTRLNLAMRSVAKADRHAVAMLPAHQRAALDNMDKSERAKFINRFRGKFVKTEGGVKDAMETSTIAGREGAALFAGDPSQYRVETERASLGKSAEGTLGAILPGLSISRGGVSAASGLDFSGARAPLQRAIKLICENKRQGLNLGTGMGKTAVALGAFTKLRAEGKAKRALFVVPANIAGQFPSEIDKFRDPATPLFHFTSEGASTSERRAALSNPDVHIVVTTPEALRGDIVRAVADHKGISESQASEHIRSAPDAERDASVHAAMTHAGMDFDYSLFDEGHRLLSRQGKPDALMAQVGDSVGARSPYYVYSTADPIKNDVSEAWDVLHKMDAPRYPTGSRDAFLRTYGRDTKATSVALQRVMQPYLYPEKIDLGVDTHQILPDGGRMRLSEPEQVAHDAVLTAYGAARRARLKGTTDIAALKILSPGSFADCKGSADESGVASGLNSALATLRDARLARVVNCTQGGTKENFISDYVGARKGQPTVVFAHHLDSVRQIGARLKAEGHKVVMMTGDMDGNTKSRARVAFQGGGGKEPVADVIVLSDAGAMGANLQRGIHQINVDVPMTAMVHQQRLGRIRRMGQTAGEINAVDLVTDTDYEQKARTRLADKAALRDLLASPSASIDDSGLTSELEARGVIDALLQAKRKYGGRT